MAEPIRIAKAEDFLTILPKMANRHGLIAGATGTGKTVTLQSMAKPTAYAVGLQLGRSIVRGVLGSILGRK